MELPEDIIEKNGKLFWLNNFLIMMGSLYSGFSFPWFYLFEMSEMNEFRVGIDLSVSILFLFTFLKNKKKKRNTWSLILALVCIIPFDALSVASPISLRALSLFRLLNIHSFIKIKEFMPKVIKVIFMGTGVLLLLHFIACGWLWIHNTNLASDPATSYNMALYWAMTTVTTVGYGDITPVSNLARIYTMFTMLAGVGFYGVVIGHFSNLMMARDKYQEQKKEKMYNLRNFMKHYNIPRNLQKDVFSFYQHILQKQLSEDDERFISELPKALQSEINLYRKIKLIRKIHIFNGCSDTCLKMIASKLNQAFYSPKQIIINQGDTGKEMFIMAHGKVDVFQKEQVIASLGPGDFFGEIALLEDTIRKADVRAKTYCDLYTLEKTDFLEIIEKFPSLKNKFEVIYLKTA